MTCIWFAPFARRLRRRVEEPDGFREHGALVRALALGRQAGPGHEIAYTMIQEEGAPESTALRRSLRHSAPSRDHQRRSVRRVLRHLARGEQQASTTLTFVHHLTDRSMAGDFGPRLGVLPRPSRPLARRPAVPQVRRVLPGAEAVLPEPRRRELRALGYRAPILADVADGDAQQYRTTARLSRRMKRSLSTPRPRFEPDAGPHCADLPRYLTYVTAISATAPAPDIDVREPSCELAHLGSQLAGIAIFEMA
jgi:hypothetical protein